jgi:hypothetical protein
MIAALQSKWFSMMLLGLMAPVLNRAQINLLSAKPESATSIQYYYFSTINNQLSNSIFSRNNQAGITINPFYLAHLYSIGFNDSPNVIDGPGTPKTAVFCRFENKLWHRLGFGLRLRVENPVTEH